MVEQHFCLRWNNYRTNITAEFETLREGEHFVDVTLACDGHQLKAHKVVLSACSPYFKELLQGNPCTHPIIILRDVAYTHMRSLLEFMYAGEVNISQVQLGAFLHTAEALKIRGLAESPDERKDQGGLNSLSPLSALKSSLSGLGSIAMGGLNTPSLLERPLVPQLLTHHPDKPPGNPVPAPHHLPPHLVPPPLTLPGSTLPTTSHGISGGPPSTSSNSSSSSTNCNVTGVHPGPLPLTTVAQTSERPSRLEAPECSPSPPPPLPPSKRLRLERKSPLEPIQEKNHHESNGTTSSSTTTTTATIHAEDITPTVPKTEPVDGGASDAEGGGGWCGQEEGDSSGGGIGGGGGGSGSGLGPGLGPGPGPGPGPGGDVKHGPTPPRGTPPDPENTSHLLQALGSESHLQGEGGVVCVGAGSVVASREVPQSCPFCSKLISNFYNLKKHIATMHQSPTYYHACAHCSAAFRTPEYLRKHLVNVHKYPVKKKK